MQPLIWNLPGNPTLSYDGIVLTIRIEKRKAIDSFRPKENGALRRAKEPVQTEAMYRHSSNLMPCWIGYLTVPDFGFPNYQMSAYVVTCPSQSTSTVRR